MRPFKIEKTHNIKFKVISSDNIRQIAKLAQSEFIKANENLEKARLEYKKLEDIYRKNEINKEEFEKIDRPSQINPEIKFSLIWENNKVDSNDINIILTEDYLPNHNINQVIIKFVEFTNWSQIDVSIQQSAECWSKSDITVSGTDETWVNGIFQQLTDIANHWKKQENWIRERTILFNGLCAVILSSGIAILYYQIYSHIKSEILTLSLVFFAFSVFFTFLLSNTFIEPYIRKLYPCIELNLGPDYLRITEQKRKSLIWIITILIIPLILNAVFFFASLLLK